VVGAAAVGGCRAVLFASLVDDPESEPEYQQLPEASRKEWAAARRAELFNLITELVQWENSNNPRVINNARAEIARCVASRKIELGELKKDTAVFGPLKGQPHPKGPVSGEGVTAPHRQGGWQRGAEGLAFLAPDSTRLRELQQSVRHYLAWLSIWNEREQLNLDQFQTKQADTKRTTADETVDVRLPETYCWLLVPGQPDPKGAVEWTDIKLQTKEGLALAAAKKLKNEELLMVGMGGARLRLELDKVPLWRGNHVGVKQLAEVFARYLYLPRLRDDDVLLAAIRDGVGLLTAVRRGKSRARIAGPGRPARHALLLLPPLHRGDRQRTGDLGAARRLEAHPLPSRW
jgi:hypothetical protein